MKLFLGYLKRQGPAIAAVAVLYLFLSAVSLLYGLPVEAPVYGAVLCLFIGGFLCAVGFQRFSRRHQHLSQLVQSVTMPDWEPPPAGDVLERDYQELLDVLRRENIRAALDSDRRFQDMLEYYTLWAHQIKTPIAAMELMLRQEEPPQPEELREQLFRIEQYVEMVLNYLRLDSDSSDFVIARFDLDAIVRQAVRKYASQFIRRKIQLFYDGLDTWVLTDEKWLLFVVEQLLSNALKYTAEGSVSIYMEEGKTLVIRDTGIGIRPEDLPRVFEKGFTGFNGREDKRSTGIGLYLTRRVCAMLGHTIDIRSAPGQGTAVRIGLDSVKLDVE